MNHAILLCPGPSLRLYEPRPSLTPPLVVAVNRAVLHAPCDVWACGDWPEVKRLRESVMKFREAKRLASPTLYTAESSRSELAMHYGGVWGNGGGQIDASDCITFESQYDGHEHDIGWTCYTATAALWYCGRTVGAGGTVEVYGADMGGDAYCDGAPLSQNRIDLGEKNWSQERHYWDRTVEALAARGVTVRRHLPDEARRREDAKRHEVMA